MFGISHALSFSTNSLTNKSTQLTTTAFQPDASRLNQNIFSRISPLRAHQLNHSQHRLPVTPGLRAQSNNANGPDLCTLAAPKAILSGSGGFISESNQVFYAQSQPSDARQQREDHMSDHDQPTEGNNISEPFRSQLVVSIDPNTLGDSGSDNMRIMINIGEDLKGQPLSVIDKALNAYLQSPDVGFRNMQVTVTQHLSPTVVIAEISEKNEYAATPSDEQAHAVAGAPKESHEEAKEGQQESQSPGAQQRERLRVKVTAAVNCLQECRGVLAIESDRQVQQLFPSKGTDNK